MIKRSDWVLVAAVATAFGLGYVVAERMALGPDSEKAVEDIGTQVHSSVREFQPLATEPSTLGEEETLPADTYVTSRAAPNARGATLSSAEAPWRRFAVAAPVPDGRPRIVIVIDDMGVDTKRTARAVRLPGPLTLAYLAYAHDGRRQAATARNPDGTGSPSPAPTRAHTIRR